jgi:hypothetical protein
MADIPYWTYGMIVPNGERTEKEYECESEHFTHPLPDAKGDGADLVCFGGIRAGIIAFTIKKEI